MNDINPDDHTQHITTTEVGQAVAVARNGVVILGRITNLLGTENPYVKGLFSIVEVTSPHGSYLTTGQFWCYDPSESQKQKLKEYEEDAKSQGKKLYRGKIEGDQSMTPYERGKQDCALDDMENAHFSSIGGLDSRTDPVPPKYINEEHQKEYLEGYISQAKQLYGEGWKTAQFSWKPVLQINP